MGSEGCRTGQREKIKYYADMPGCGGASGDSPGSPGALVAPEVKGLGSEAPVPTSHWMLAGPGQGT